MRLILLGTGTMAEALLARMVVAGMPPLALLLPTARGTLRAMPAADALTLPMAPTSPRMALLATAQRARLPIFEVGQWDGAALAWLAEQRADVAVVACWPARLPQHLLSVPAGGFWNLHPSALPEYRGPMPFFWQRRDGLTESAMTWHCMSAALDAGRIIAQQRMSLPDGADMATLDAMAGSSAFPLLADALATFSAGELRPIPQPSGGNYQGYPTANDYEPSPSWSAQHRDNFFALFRPT